APSDFAMYGIPFKQRKSRFEEGLRILQQAIQHEEFSFAGTRYDVGPIRVTPRPVQQPLPVYVAAWSDVGVERAAQWGNGWITDTINTSATLLCWADTYRATCERERKQPEIILMREAFCGPTRSEAEAQYAPYILEAHRMLFSFGGYNPAVEPWMVDVPTAADLQLHHIKDDRFILGDPQDCIEQIEHFIHNLGATTFILRFRQASGPSHEEVVEAIRLFGREVIPYFREKYPA
ncbi:MAG: LLM class flavin-dependent oxidoreductase, partial [Chloroflexaceae bacterium]|nr:LLM class flavin-dependent oxidoreductase [Chloroflexaceae bacterium]